jgi:hypothetical protein
MSNPTELPDQRMSKEAWIDAATALLPAQAWRNPDDVRTYAESLYETFVVDFDDPDCTPTDAVNEDMSNWGD